MATSLEDRQVAEDTQAEENIEAAGTMRNDGPPKANIDELLAEMSECREDERNAQNQMVQVIATAGTILTLIFGVNFIPDLDNIPKNLLFHLSNLVFCTAVGFITVLGIGNVLRYHYLQRIEDNLFRLAPHCLDTKQQFIHWMSFSAPITTRNPKNVKGHYTWMHYMCYAVATICPIAFCGVMTIIQYLSLKARTVYDKLSVGLLIGFFSCSMIAFFYCSFKAREMFEFAQKGSMRKVSERLKIPLVENEENQESGGKSEETQEVSTGLLKAIFYFIYPKKKDLQKPLLIAIGFVSGIFLFNDVRPVGTALKQFAVIFVAIDFLLYQARYQWNDIRGLAEDQEAHKKDRLPKIKGDKNDKLSVILSFVIIVVRIVSLVFVIAYYGGEMTFPLVVCSILIVVIAIGYEWARTKEKNGLVIFLVCFGYPLRFLVGLWSAHPETEIIFKQLSAAKSVLLQFWNNGRKEMELSVWAWLFVLLLLLISYALWGRSSVLLAWGHEAVKEKNSKKKYFKYPKNEWVKKATIKIGGSPEVGKYYFGGCLAYFCSMIPLFIICVTICHFKLFLSCVFMAFEALIVVLSYFVAVPRCYLSKNNQKTWILWLFPVLIAVKPMIFVFWSEYYLFYIYISLTQAMFTVVYFFMRYNFDPKFDFVETIVKLIMGKKTFDHISQKP